MRTLALATAVYGLMLAAADAADLQFTSINAAPSYGPSWTGFYVGGHFGGEIGTGGATNPFAGVTDYPGINGFVAGFQGGFNYQMNRVVVGIEGTFNGAEVANTTIDSAGFSHYVRNSWTATVTGRLGYTFDAVLLYAKGGVAFADDHESISDPFSSNADAGDVQRTGWTVGAGAEYAVTDHWSAKLEYDFLDLGTKNLTFSGPVLGTMTAPVEMDLHQVVAGINYRF